MINLAEIKAELYRLSELEDKITAVLDKAPEGNIYFQKTGQNTEPVPYIDCYADGKRHRLSLKHADPSRVKGLLFKRYAKVIRKQTEHNLHALQSILAYKPFTEEIKNYGGERFHECRTYFFGKPVSNPEFDALKERQNPYHPEQLDVKSDLGAFRSREELLSAEAMHHLGLRFKYETPLAVGMYFRYPDFAVLHPCTGKIIYIEYAGKPADPDYQRDLQQRIRDYANVGVFLGVNLFILAPTPGEGFDLSEVTSRLKGIFCL